MTRTRRTRVIAAGQQSIWALIADPHHQPRWWPGVQRMEGVAEDTFTQVHMTKKGRPVRIDFTVLVSEPPWRRVWQQEVQGTPFERVLKGSVTEILLEPHGADATEVTIELRQQLRGYSRTGGFLLRRATRTRLEEALAGIERSCGAPGTGAAERVPAY